MTQSRYAIGIDLGTTHCALAELTLEGDSSSAVFNVPQLVGPSTLEAQALLPSFVYFPAAAEGALPLPWDEQRSFAVGNYARVRAAEAPNRVVSSAKSWLSHTLIDRRAGVLPTTAPADVEKISPVEAAFRYLDHLSEAWQRQKREQGAELNIAEQDVIITVPASFDAAARDLTVEAAYAAGLDNVSLLEEPQAALYAWIEMQGANWRKHLSAGDVVLVIDIGGGTTDFSAIWAIEKEGNLELHRIAVGDHILLGGDNMDLALSHRARQRFEEQGQKLDNWQLLALTHACRSAKERLFNDPSLRSVPLALASRGSQLLAGVLRTELLREDVESLLLDGFFPSVEYTATPSTRTRAGLSQLGLPYAHDPAITKHLAAFLRNHAQATSTPGAEPTPRALLHPTAILFNGGVIKAAPLRERMVQTLDRWLLADGGSAVRILPGEDPDLAVARGAAYYGRVRRGQGLRIRGGTAHAYYVGIESPMPAIPGMEPPLSALCVAPFGLEEGSAPEQLPQELALVVGEAVRFRFFTSSIRRADQVGTELEHWQPGELHELSPIEISLPANDYRAGDVVPVHLRAQVTAVGTLLLEALPSAATSDEQRWKIELSVREPTPEQ